MVKRPKSPEAAEDDKYFTVYKPYPLNANWEVENDCIACARWIAACIGPDPLHALYYKPSARSMILLEVDKKYPNNERLLGEHRWSEFIKQPSNEEGGKVTQIFHSLYSKGREAQKDGWKRIHVEAMWFKNLAESTKGFQDPYPQTFWCPTPPEDRTNKPMCRPLPVKDKAPPERPAPSVVGSANWVTAKAAPSPNTPHARKDAWERGRNTGPSPVSSASIAAGSAWNKPIIQNKPATSPTVWNKNITSTAISPQSGDRPPGLGSRTPSNNVKPPNVAPALPSPPALVHSSSQPSSSNSSSGLSWGDQPLEEAFEDQVTVSLSPSQDRALYGYDDEEDELHEMDETTILQPWEQGIGGNLWASDNGYAGKDPRTAEPEITANLWGEEQTSAVKKPTVAKCPYHDHECRKGVCAWRAKNVREEEREKEQRAKEEKRRKARGERADEGGRGAGGGAGRRGGDGATAGSNTSKSNTASDNGFTQVARAGKGNGRGKGKGKGKEAHGWDATASVTSGRGSERD